MKYRVHAWSLEREWTVNRIFRSRKKAEADAQWWKALPEIILVEIEEIPSRQYPRLLRIKR